MVFLGILALSFYKKTSSPEDVLIRETFEKYKTAILNDQGEEAVKYVDSRTLKYYGNILESVKNDNKEKVNSLSISDRLSVLLIRQMASRQEIQSFDAKTFFVYFVNKGMVGKNGVANNSIGTIINSGNFAKGELVINKKNSTLYLHFYKENDMWKIDLTSLLTIANIAVQQVIKTVGQSEEEFIFSSIEMVTGKKPDESVWNPIK